MEHLNDLIASLQARLDALPTPSEPTLADLAERSRLTHILVGLNAARTILGQPS